MKTPQFTTEDIAALEAGLARRNAEIDAHWALIGRLMKAAFAVGRDPRSGAYRCGVQDMLAFKLFGKPLENPFELGTPIADAWFAGNAEGISILKLRQRAPMVVAA